MYPVERVERTTHTLYQYDYQNQLSRLAETPCKSCVVESKPPTLITIMTMMTTRTPISFREPPIISVRPYI